MSAVVVVGSINADIVVRAARLPGRGETVIGETVSWHAGGKGANQAAAAAAAGAATTFIGCVGDDAHGSALAEAISGFGVEARLRTVPGPSGQAFITVDAAGDNQIVVVAGANDHLSAADVEGATFRPGDVAVAALECPPEIVLAFLRAAEGATTILNPSPVERCTPTLLAAADIVVVNEHEQALLGHPHPRVVVTLGADGVRVGDHHVPGRDVSAVDTTGAGDCFLGTLAARIAAGDDLVTASETANDAAARSTTRPGAMESYR